MKLNIISFNIRYCDDPDGYSIAERAPRLATVTSKYDADILGFQECRAQWLPYLEKYYSGEYDMFLKYRSTGPWAEGSPIYWRKDKFDCLKTGYFWFSDTPEVESRGWDELFNCYRICEYVILKEKESGNAFTVMNTHLGFGDKGQVDSANLIYEYSKKISDLPTIVFGDFNMVPESLGYQAMIRHFTDVNACTANDLRTTYHGYDPETVGTAHIDYCFIDSAVKPVNQVIITDTVDGKYPSDHFGLHIQLEL